MNVPDSYRLYGLRVRSDVPLHQRCTVTDRGRADVRIRIGGALPVSRDYHGGEVIARHEIEGRESYLLTRLDDGSFLMRYTGACDFLVSADLRDVVVRLPEGAEPGLAGVLAVGSLLAFVLMMAGEAVLHASAMQIGNRALAFVGSSGMGKSTMAALIGASGAALITDDVLRLDLAESSVRCHLGATELRLRKSAAELAGRFEDAPAVRVTSDLRDALRVPAATDDLLPLAAIVVPRPTRDLDAVAIQKLSAVEALHALIRFPRILGWQDVTTHIQQFQHLATLAERVPVYLADVPWGPPFSSDIAPAVLAAVGL